MKHNCTTCLFSHHVTTAQDIRGTHFCRRYPPTVSIFAAGGQIANGQGFPRVDEGGICGEYISADGAATDFFDAAIQMKAGVQ